MSRRGRPGVLAPARLSPYVLAASLGCATRGEPPDCLEQRQEARNRALAGDLEQAEGLLERVKQRCGPNSQSDIQHIGKLIAEKKAARREREEREANRSALLREFPSKSFVEWATDRAGDISGKVPSVSCAERGTPLFGFCEGQREQAPGISLRYWQAEPGAFRYSLETQAPPSCQDLGEYRLVRSWQRDGSQLELCELTSRRLRHLSALIVHTPPRHEMFIFSQEYLGLDPGFERRASVVDKR
jgi:hypothetical protein